MNVIYIHVCCINNYEEVFRYLLNSIKECGLYNNINEIRCCILGQFNDSLFDDEKIIIRATSNDISLYERYTINIIHSDCKNENMNVLYLHTKGVTRQNNIFVKSWVNYLVYFNIYHHKLCLELLESNDTVGVNLQNEPKLHYSGNFWWSKSSYINKLTRCIDYSYNAPEFWLTEHRFGKYMTLWNSNCNHYINEYSKENYENKEISPYTV